MADVDYDDLALAIDGHGGAHVVASDRRGILYWTNENGNWTRERIGTAADGAERDRNPAIAIDDTGSVVVAFERSACYGLGCDGARVFVTTKTAVGWSAPDFVATGTSPSVATAAGTVGIAYPAIEGFDDEACERSSPVDYSVSSDGGWLTQPVAMNGDYPALALARDGTPHVLLTDRCGLLGEAGLYLAIPDGAGGPFALRPIPGTVPDGDVGYAVAVDEALTDHLLYRRFSEDGSSDQSVYVIRAEGRWSEPIEPVGARAARWMAVDESGNVHVLAEGGGEGLWHATNASGAFVIDQVAPDTTASYNEGALVLDADGRPHVLFETGDGEGGRIALWYGVLVAP